MAGKTPRPEATREQTLSTLHKDCPCCAQRMWFAYEDRRKVTTLEEVIGVRLQVRRCVNAACERYHVAYRPEAEGGLALPHHEFGLDVMARIGQLRYRQHRSIPEIHQQLQAQGVVIAERTVDHLLARYEELVSVSVADRDRLQAVFQGQGRLIVALDGLQPDKGQEVLWVIREVLSGAVLLARSLLSSSEAELAGLLKAALEGLEVPVVGVISDGQQAIRKAVAAVLPGVPHQLCQFDYLREAARPIWEADRHAKKELKKCVRGVRPLERQAERQAEQPMEPQTEQRSEPQAEQDPEPQAEQHPEQDPEPREIAEGRVVRGYCAAVRRALTGEGRLPLELGGLRLRERLAAVVASLERVAKKGGLFNRCRSSNGYWSEVWSRLPACGRRSRWPRTGSRKPLRFSTTTMSWTLRR